MSLIPKKGTVYVVDDDEAVRDSLQWLLEGKDYRVRCFDSAESFLARFDPREVACLIVDVRMGGMTGLELQDRLLERKSPLPIVFITGHGDVPMAVNTMKKGAMDFIQKPFKEDELLSLVEQQLVVEFCVQDSGKGVPPEMLERIYEAFYSTKAEGMGIGLKLCRSIVEAHHGRLQARNLYNPEGVVGCEFSFWIPVAAPLQGADLSTPAPPGPGLTAKD